MVFQSTLGARRGAIAVHSGMIGTTMAYHSSHHTWVADCPGSGTGDSMIAITLKMIVRAYRDVYSGSDVTLRREAHVPAVPVVGTIVEVEGSNFEVTDILMHDGAEDVTCWVADDMVVARNHGARRPEVADVAGISARIKTWTFEGWEIDATHDLPQDDIIG